MLLIGLTGGIGMGKSTVADYLVRTGEQVLDTDVLARRFVEPGEPALEEIRRQFGSAVFAEDQLDRKALAQLVFKNVESRKTLEAILHPRIRAAWRKRAEDWKREGLHRAFVVIPLLYETGAQTEVGRVICIGCSAGVQRRRLSARGWSDTEIDGRLAAQWSIGKKMDLADGVVWNESTMSVCEEQCRRLLASNGKSAQVS